MRPSLNLKRVRRRHDAILGERRPFEVAVPADGGFVLHEAPQPGYVDAIRGQIIHEAQRKLIVVDRGCEVTVENLKAIVAAM